MKYRKHVLVDAIQLSKDNYRLVERFSQGTAYPANVRVSNGRTAVKEVFIRRHKEPQLVKVGDWVVRDENGEFYACSSESFAKAYEAVKEEKRQ